MAKEDKSFADLVAEAPPAPTEGTVSLVGTLAKSSEPDKFVLTLQDGRSVTLETSAVKGHSVLGSSIGRTIIQVEVEGGKVPNLQPFAQEAISPLVTGARFDVYKPPSHDKQPILDKLPIEDIKLIRDNDNKVISDWNGKSVRDVKDPYLDGYGFGPIPTAGVAPFALATPHQAPANVIGALNAGFVSHRMKLPGAYEHTNPLQDNKGAFSDVYNDR